MFAPRHQSTYGMADLYTAWRQGKPPAEDLRQAFGGECSFHLSASDALAFCLHRLRGRRRILIPAYICDRVVRAAIGAGYEPLFCDVDATTGVLDAEALRRLAPGEVGAVIAAHIFGTACDIEALQRECVRLGAVLIEDCALGMLPPAGGDAALAPVSIFSFGRAKTVSFGAGGMLVVRDRAVAHCLLDPENSAPGRSRRAPMVTDLRIAYLLLAYWSPLWRTRVRLERVVKLARGPHSGLAAPDLRPLRLRPPSPFAARMLAYLLQHTDCTAERRHRSAINHVYEEAIVASELLRRPHPPNGSPGYPLLVGKRADLAAALLRRGIDTSRFFSYSVGAAREPGRFPNSERMAREILILPNHRRITPDMARRISAAVNTWLRNQTQP